MPDREDRLAAKSLHETGRFTLERIGELLGVSKSTVQRWVKSTPSAEDEPVGPNETRVRSWADALDLADTVLAMRVDAMLTLAIVMDAGRQRYAKGIDRQAAVSATKELVTMVEGLGQSEGFDDLRKALLGEG